MYLARHETLAGPRWALDGQFLPLGFTLDLALQLPRASLAGFLGDAAARRAGVRSVAGAARAGTRGLGQRRDLPAQPGGARGRVRG